VFCTAFAIACGSAGRPCEDWAKAPFLSAQLPRALARGQQTTPQGALAQFKLDDTNYLLKRGAFFSPSQAKVRAMKIVRESSHFVCWLGNEKRLMTEPFFSPVHQRHFADGVKKMLLGQMKRSIFMFQ